MFETVNIVLDSITGCSFCSFSAVNTTTFAIPVCQVGFSLDGSSSECIDVASCTSGVLVSGGCSVNSTSSLQTPQCASGSTLKYGMDFILCVMPAKQVCPIGWTAISGANASSPYICEIVCPSPSFYRVDGACIQQIICPSGTIFNASQPLRGLCLDINECSGANPCQNNGACSNGYGSYSCSCAIGYSGTNCAFSPSLSSSSASTVGIAVGVGVGGGCLILILIVAVLYRRRTQGIAATNDTPDTKVASGAEIDAKYLQLMEIIGQGVYGTVYHGLFKVSTCILYLFIVNVEQNAVPAIDVAVKTLPQRGTEKKSQLLTKEIRMLKRLKPDENLVSFDFILRVFLFHTIHDQVSWAVHPQLSSHDSFGAVQPWKSA